MSDKHCQWSDSGPIKMIIKVCSMPTTLIDDDYYESAWKMPGPVSTGSMVCALPSTLLPCAESEKKKVLSFWSYMAPCGDIIMVIMHGFGISCSKYSKKHWYVRCWSVGATWYYEDHLGSIKVDQGAIWLQTLWPYSQNMKITQKPVDTMICCILCIGSSLNVVERTILALEGKCQKRLFSQNQDQ